MPGVLATGVTLAVAGCAADGATTTAADPGRDAEAVTCSMQYRPDAESAAGQRSESVTVPAESGVVGDEPGARLEFPDLVFEVTYVAGAPDGNGVTTVVRATDDDSERHRVLHQLPAEPGLVDIVFAGGHGFTGLHYANHEDAQLQYWCTAE
ncbi:hypothetical protein RIF23_10200 [Lipingzhangella sp. LS1_29]|uniref:Lipoprotein n=2 Tax=Lipingzhangella rawalii TaxID=2055835 RepID=A0ABU2H5V2_9ACTN|nr:hypothetical protein [Lipingzhangella rawalii]